MEEEIRVSSYEGHAGRLIQASIRRGTDLVNGIIEICRQQEIRTGIILSCIGSLQNAEISWPVPAQTKRGSARIPPTVIPGPIELVSGQGVVCALQECPAIHFHGTLVDRWGRVWAGHILRDGNPILSTMDVTIQEIFGVHMEWFRDPEIDLEIMIPRAGDE